MTHHRLVLRQLRNLLKDSEFESPDAFLLEISQGSEDALQTLRANFPELLKRIGDTYSQFDRDLELRTRSLELSSSEMTSLNSLLLQEREKTNAKLLETELRFQLALKATQLGLWDWLVREQTVYFSPEWYGQLGYADRELPMTFATWDQLVHPDDRDSAYKSLNDHLQGAAEEFDIELRMKCKRGGWKWIRSRGKVVARDERGEALRVVGTHIDMSVQKLAEKALSDAKEAAESSNRLKGEFLANMSHEIRTPLNAIIGISDVALSSPLEAPVKDMIETISTSAKDLSAIINDILDFSKIEAGKLKIESLDLRLPQFLDETTKIFSSRIQEKGLRFTTEIDPSLPTWVVTDPLRLRQVLNNLLSNAIKFTSQGSVTLTVALKERVGSETLIQFSVRDTGIGIPAQKIDRLFHTFMQADSSITRRFGGTGLGLAISRRLAELLGGEIWVESSEGHGSTFHFTIRAKAIALEKGSDERSRSGGGLLACATRPLKILLVEDVYVNQVMMKMLLKKIGHQVTLAESGKIATELFFREKWDLVLMDLQMPEMDGLEATRYIRSKEGTATRTPIIALTANAMADDSAKCFAAGMDAYLTKPINTDQFLSTIKKLAL